MAMNNRLMRPLASGFNPKSVSGLSLWLDANDASTITTDTGVSEWRDKSGNGRHFTQTTGNNQPTLSAIGSKTAISFNGTSHRLTRSAAFVTGNMSVGAFVVMEGVFPSTACRVIDSRDANTGDQNAFNIELRADQGASWLFGTLRTRVRNTRSSTAYISDQRFDSVNVSGVGLVTFIGSYAASASTNVSYWNNAAAPSTSGTSDGGGNPGINIGCNLSTTASGFYTGKIGEVVIYSAALSTAQRLTIQNYLARKWGVVLA